MASQYSYTRWLAVFSENSNYSSPTWTADSRRTVLTPDNRTELLRDDVGVGGHTFTVKQETCNQLYFENRHATATVTLTYTDTNSDVNTMKIGPGNFAVIPDCDPTVELAYASDTVNTTVYICALGTND